MPVRSSQVGSSRCGGVSPFLRAVVRSPSALTRVCLLLLLGVAHAFQSGCASPAGDERYAATAFAGATRLRNEDSASASGCPARPDVGRAVGVEPSTRPADFTVDPPRNVENAIEGRGPLAQPDEAVRSLSREPRRLGIWWRLEGMLGWGNYGGNVVAALARRRAFPALDLVLMVQPATGKHTPVHADIAEALWESSMRDARSAALFACLARHGTAAEGRATPGRCTVDYPVIHAFGDYLSPTDDAWPPVWGTHNALLVFFEREHLPPRVTARMGQYEAVVAGSSWNAESLRRAGVRNVVTVFQGVDGRTFDRPAVLERVQVHSSQSTRMDGFKLSGLLSLGAQKSPTAAEDRSPTPRADLTGRFVIFSGGKLEFRKGQDIVLAAFRAFRVAHPGANAFLLTAWHNFWPDSVGPVDMLGHVTGITESDTDGPSGAFSVRKWLARNGIAEEDALDIGAVSPSEMAAAMAHADAAVFASRAESGTNLVAMEAMAMGLPVVLTNCTGHVDIVRDGAHCFPLTRLRNFDGVGSGVPAGDLRDFLDGLVGYRDAEPAEIVEQLARIYADPAGARRRGQLAAELMRRAFTWERTADVLVDALQRHGVLS